MSRVRDGLLSLAALIIIAVGVMVYLELRDYKGTIKPALQETAQNARELNKAFDYAQSLVEDPLQAAKDTIGGILPSDYKERDYVFCNQSELREGRVPRKNAEVIVRLKINTPGCPPLIYEVTDLATMGTYKTTQMVQVKVGDKWVQAYDEAAGRFDPDQGTIRILE